MAGRKRRVMPRSIPLSLLAMPVGGALAVAMTVVNRPLSALSATPGSMTPSAILDLQGLPSARKQAEKGDERGRQHHTWRLGNRRAGAVDSGSSVGDQAAALDTDQRPFAMYHGDSEEARARAEHRLRRGLRELGQLRQPQNVLELLAAAKGRGDVISLRVFNTAIAAVAACEGGCRHALRLLVLMDEERVAPDRFTFTAVAASCCRCQQWNVAYRVLAEMQRRGLRPLDMRPSRLTTSPGEPFEARDKVLRLLQHLRSSSPQEQGRLANSRGRDGVRDSGSSTDRPREGESVARRIPYDDAGSALSRAGKFEADERRTAGHGAVASALNGQLASRADKTDGPEGTAASATLAEASVDALLAAGIRPGYHMFLSELKAAANAKESVRALRLLDVMHEAGHRPSQGAYACAIRACGRDGKWEMSLALMDEMRSSGLEPEEGCHVMALKACAAAGLWEKALEMLGEMRAARVNRSESSFVVAMKACGDAGRWREAVSLMDDMRRDGVPPMETAYTTAMKACGSAGEWQQALHLFSEMRAIGIPPTELCFTAVIRACAKADEIEKALSILHDMRVAEGVLTNMASYRAVIQAYCKAGDWAPAVGLLEDARRELLKPETGDLRVLVQACGEAGQHERALSLLEEMRSEGMGMRRTGAKLAWVFNNCRDKRVKGRAWALMEVEETRERVRLRADRNAQLAASGNAPAAASEA